jgi:hypothetical protein
MYPILWETNGSHLLPINYRYLPEWLGPSYRSCRMDLGHTLPRWHSESSSYREISERVPGCAASRCSQIATSSSLNFILLHFSEVPSRVIRQLGTRKNDDIQRPWLDTSPHTVRFRDLWWYEISHIYSIKYHLHFTKLLLFFSLVFMLIMIWRQMRLTTHPNPHLHPHFKRWMAPLRLLPQLRSCRIFSRSEQKVCPRYL